MDFVSKVMSLLFNMLSRLVIAFLPRSKHLLISWLQSPSAMIFEPKIIKSVTASTYSPTICYEVMGLDTMILLFWMLTFKPTFSFSSFTLIQRLFSSSSLSAIRVVSFAYLKLLLFFILFCPLLLLPHFSLSTVIFSFPCFPLFFYEITVRNAMFPAISVNKRCHSHQWLQLSIVSWWAPKKHRAEKNTCHLAAIRLQLLLQRALMKAGSGCEKQNAGPR